MTEETKQVSELDTEKGLAIDDRTQFNCGGGGTALIGYTMQTAWKQ